MYRLEEDQAIYVVRQAIKQLLTDDDFISVIKSLIDYAKVQPQQSNIVASEVLSAGYIYDEYKKVIKDLNTGAIDEFEND